MGRKTPNFAQNSENQVRRLGAHQALSELDSRQRIATIGKIYEPLPDSLDSLEAQVRELLELGQVSTYQLARRLKEIKDKQLYKDRGFEDFKSYVAKVLPFEAAWAYQNIQLIETFDRDIVERFGTRLVPAISFIRRHGDEAKTRILEFVEERGGELRQADVRSHVKNLAPSEGTRRQATSRRKAKLREVSAGKWELESADLSTEQLKRLLQREFEIESI